MYTCTHHTHTKQHVAGTQQQRRVLSLAQPTYGLLGRQHIATVTHLHIIQESWARRPCECLRVCLPARQHTSTAAQQQHKAEH